MTIKENLDRSITKSQNAYEIMQEVYAQLGKEDRHKEIFYTIGLDSQNRILVIELIALGTIDRCIPYVREILYTAISKKCTSLILIHNHPSGSLKPSTQDKRLTDDVKKACQLCQVRLLDHIILGKANSGYFSFNDKGIL